MNTGEWWLDHPGKAMAVILAPSLILGLGGVGLAWLLVSIHAVSPDNVLAGVGCGFGGALAGLVVGLLAVSSINHRAP